MRWLLLLCMLLGAAAHSPIFVSDDLDTIEIIRDPTHSWTYYTGDFLVNVFEHVFKADYQEGDEMYFEYYTPRNDITDPPCFDLQVAEEVEHDGFHLVNILIKKVDSYLYCTEPYFDPWSITAHNTHGHYNKTATNRTRVVVYISHTQKPYALSVGSTEGVMFRDLIRWSYIRVRLQLWQDTLTMPWSLLIGQAVAIGLWLWNPRQGFYKTPGTLITLLIVFTYFGTFFDNLYNYIRIANLEMGDKHMERQFAAFLWVNIVLPLLLFGLSILYFVLKEEKMFQMEGFAPTAGCMVGTWFEHNVGIDLLIILSFILLSVLVFQPGFMLASFWWFVLFCYEWLMYSWDEETQSFIRNEKKVQTSQDVQEAQRLLRSK